MFHIERQRVQKGYTNGPVVLWHEFFETCVPFLCKYWCILLNIYKKERLFLRLSILNTNATVGYGLVDNIQM